jgi:hypothetical protein
MGVLQFRGEMSPSMRRMRGPARRTLGRQTHFDLAGTTIGGRNGSEGRLSVSEDIARCGGAIDLRTIDRHPLASVGTLVLGLRCLWWPESAPMRSCRASRPRHRRRPREPAPSARPKGGDGSHRLRRHLKGSSRRSPMPRIGKPQACQAAALRSWAQAQSVGGTDSADTSAV